MIRKTELRKMLAILFGVAFLMGNAAVFAQEEERAEALEGIMADTESTFSITDDGSTPSLEEGMPHETNERGIETESYEDPIEDMGEANGSDPYMETETGAEIETERGEEIETESREEPSVISDTEKTEEPISETVLQDTPHQAKTEAPAQETIQNIESEKQTEIDAPKKEDPDHADWAMENIKGEDAEGGIIQEETSDGLGEGFVPEIKIFLSFEGEAGAPPEEEAGKGCITYGNTKEDIRYEVDEMELIWAIVAQEDNGSYEGALAVISSAKNRTESKRWQFFGRSVLEQLMAPGQYCYSNDDYWRVRLGGNVPGYVKQAVYDCLYRGIRNHPYTCFRSKRGKITGPNAEKIGGNWFFGS